MSICPKNKSSKARRDKRRANWKMSAPEPCKVQQMWRAYDALIVYARHADHTTSVRS